MEDQLLNDILVVALCIPPIIVVAWTLNGYRLLQKSMRKKND